VKYVFKFILRLLWLGLVLPHLKHIYPAKHLKIHVTEVFLANKFDPHSPGYFFDSVVIWFAVWPKATKLTDLCYHFSVVWCGITLSSADFICLVIDMIHSVYISDPALPKNDIECLHVIQCKPPRICVAVIPQFEFQAHLLPSLNAVFFLVIHCLHDYPASISHF